MFRLLVFACAVGLTVGRDIIGLHHINMLTDEVLDVMRGRFLPFVELEDLEYESVWGQILCRGGNGTGLTALARHGYARQRHYYGVLNYVNASLSLNPFTFKFADCKVELNGTLLKGSLAGTLQGASVFMNMLVESSSSSSCTAEMLEMTLKKGKVRLEGDPITTLIQHYRLMDVVMQKLQVSIMECINLTIVEYTDIKFNNLHHCLHTKVNATAA